MLTTLHRASTGLQQTLKQLPGWLEIQTIHLLAMPPGRRSKTELNKMTTCVKYFEHKEASWKLHMGCILEGQEDSKEFKLARTAWSLKRGKKPQATTKYEREEKSVYFLLNEAVPWPCCRHGLYTEATQKCLQVFDVFCHSSCVLWIRLKTKQKQC